MAEDIYTPFFKNFFLPQYESSFRGDFEEVRVLYFTSRDSTPREIKLQAYPFMTLYDLKIMLYQHFRNEISAHPSFQSLLIPLPQMVEENDELRFITDTEHIGTDYRTFEYLYTKVESTTPFNIMDPFLRASGEAVDLQFVSESGARSINYISRARMTLEDFMTEMKLESLTLHLFLYKDIVPGLRSDLRTSEREWRGRISPYYPDLAINQQLTSLPIELMKRAAVYDAYVTNMITQLEHLDELLTSETLPLLPMVVAGCRLLRLIWKKTDQKVAPLETLFYKIEVTHERPFLRILPVGEAPITKLKMDTAFRIPDVSDPRLLLTWKEERSPKPDKDYMFSKLVIRSTIGTQPALYGTLRLFDDHSADFIIKPPKQLRFLDPRSDLSAIGSLLAEGLKGLPMASTLPEIGQASIACAIRLPLQAKMITTDILRKRLTHFQTMFQEALPLPGDKPLITLRYRCVSNFANEDKLFSFLTMLSSRSIVKGDAAIPELVAALSKEFQLTEEEAQSKVIYWLRNRGELQLAVPENKDYIMTYNPGIDIAIFAQQSYYTIHIYNIDSKKVFDRIVTAVSLLLSAKERDFGAPQESVAPLLAATSTTMPGSEQQEETVADELVDDNKKVEEEEAFNLNANVGELNAGDNAYLALMMGGPSAEENQQNAEQEVFNLTANTRGENVNVSEKVQEDTRAANALVAATTVSIPQQQQVVKEETEEAANDDNGVVGKKKSSYQGWVKSQLQIADQRLFQYDTDIAGRKIRKYVTMCQATESRQPFVLNQEQFDVMNETYANDPGVIFVTYPLEQGEALPQAGDEVYTLLKYGTNPSKQNYYLCCQFFCTKDYIMVREKDFYSTTDRQGKPKPGESAPGKKDMGSCPFCHKLEIKVLKAPQPNEAVIQRRPKKGESKRHLYVSFLKGETQHPEEFYMPCCFTEDTPLYISDARFDKVRGEEKKDDGMADDEAAEEVRTTVGVPTVSYQITMYRAHKKYIVGPEKEILKISEIDGPQVGLIPPVLDKYFGQDPKLYVSREANKMELLPDAKCFLRVGVENRSPYRHNSFLAALAPYLDFRNNVESVKQRIEEVITPRIFTFLNYGNLVLEFYDPSDPGPSLEELKLWLSRELQVDLNATNQDAAIRIWKSYHRFMGYFLDSTEPKEYRQFAQMLALPGLIAPRGLILIVLELNDKNELNVRCPPFGYNVEQYSSSDFAFILHRSNGVWEPLFYSFNRGEIKGFPARHQPEITFQRSLEAAWPSVVKQRVIEFVERCQGPGRGAYTSTRNIDPMALLPLSRAIQSRAQIATGVVRDAYNHVVAITYRAQAGKPGLVALPVIDDEFIAVTRTIHLDWDDFTPAPIDLVVKFYRENFEEIFSLYPGYRVKRRVKCQATDKYVAVQLANGLYIPAGPPKVEKDIEGLKLTYVEEMDWSLNRQIYFGTPSETCKSDEEIKALRTKEKESQDPLIKAREEDFQEIFEHLRLTFSNWFSSASSSEFRSSIKKIIDEGRLPLYEKRKRLEILLGPTVLGWMDTTKPSGDQEGSLLRVDCRLEAKAPCPARCVWRQNANEDGNAGVGKCYLHSPKDIHLGGRVVNGPHLLMMRLFEELLRFPERRQQLLSGSVTTLVTLKEAVKIGEQYVLPEGSVAWHDLLRLDWLEAGKEKAKFYEEMSRQRQTTEEVAEVQAKTETKTESEEEEEVALSIPLPDMLKDLFGKEDIKTNKLYLLKAPKGTDFAPLNPYLVPLGTSAAELGMNEKSSSLNKDAVKRLTLKIRRPVLYIDTLFEPPEVLAYGPLRKQKSPTPFILISTEEGPLVLSSSSTSYRDVQPAQMPQGLFDLYDDRVGIKE